MYIWAKLHLFVLLLYASNLQIYLIFKHNNTYIPIIYPKLYLHISQIIPADICDYIFRYPRLYLQISQIIPADIPDYIYRYPRLYLQISQIIPADIPDYTFRYPRLYLQISQIMPVEIRDYIFKYPRLCLQISQIIPADIQYYTVKPLITNTSKEFINSYFSLSDNGMLQIFSFLIKWLYGTL